MISPRVYLSSVIYIHQLNHLFLFSVICLLNHSFTSIKCFTVSDPSLFTPLTDSVAAHIMHREKLPGSPVLSRRVTKRWGAQESQGGGPERRVKVLFRMFFQLQNRLQSRLQHKGLSMHHFLQPFRGEWGAGRGPLQGT